VEKTIAEQLTELKESLGTLTKAEIKTAIDASKQKLKPSKPKQKKQKLKIYKNNLLNSKKQPGKIKK
jgi:hypothetical protein